MRADNNDPLCRFLVSQGVPSEPDVTKPTHTTVFSFPQKSPEEAICTSDVTAIDQLNTWKMFADNWCDHNPSVTVQVRENEWVGVFNWMYENWESLCGIALLPYSDHIYKQAPYQELTREEYCASVKNMPTINWAAFEEYETEDNTSGTHDLACSGGSCEIVDLT